jgi:hypothetical protein
MLAGIVIGVLAIVGWIKPYLNGPDLAVATIYRPRPVAVQVERVKWLNRVETKIVRERVEVPVEVIREIPAKEAKRLEDDFHIKVADLQKESRELIDVVAVPKAPHGGEMALTVNTESGKIDGIFRATPAPVVEFGGLRELGAELDPLNQAVTGYYRQDLLRVGPIVVSGRAFVTGPLAPGRVPTYGAAIGASVRF